MSDYYDRDGNPITSDQWVEAYRDNSFLLDERGGYRISTVYLGLNHAYDGGPPLIFETMIFGGGLDGDCWRYSSKADAEEGHRHAVAVAESALAAAFADVPEASA